MIHLEVAVEAPLYKSLSYLFPKNEQSVQPLEEDEYIGRRVLAPLGGRIVTGYVLALKYQKDPDLTLRHINRFITGSPLFSREIVDFFWWVSRYYQHPIGGVISTALPAGLSRSSKKIIRLLNPGDDIYQVSKTKKDDAPEWIARLNKNGQLSPTATRKVIQQRDDAKLLKKLVGAGIAEIETVLNESLVRDKSEDCFIPSMSLELPDIEKNVDPQNFKNLQKQISSRLDTELLLSETKALYFLNHLARNKKGPIPKKEILNKYKGGSKPLISLCSKGIVECTRERIYRNPLGDVPDFYPRPERLTSEQLTAKDAICATLDKDKFAPFLLHGITGSGKTEVYLRATEYCLEKGRDILVLVPEIALATQLEAHFISRFGKNIALLHSGLSPGVKYDQWSLAASGQTKIVIGARSAVFAPLKNIGLIIVDEEHDAGFKQHDGLKYNGRDLAVLRAKMVGCTVILGSATPSVTSYHHGVNGKYQLLNMKKRVGESKLPAVEIIDLSKNIPESGKTPFHNKFLAELERNLLNREQSLVLINRRGFSSSLLCQECGSSVQCNHCNIALTFHKRGSTLLCHYCGYSISHKIICSNCHSDALIPFGYGTERIEEELQQRFPDAIIQRLDSDIAHDRKKSLAIIKGMRDRKIDILIGTQMIAKGYHFPMVTFVGVVWADGGINMPDFRAAERTFQLLSQVTGRAGREEKAGRVIIQTMLPKHYALTAAETHDYQSFYQREISLRKHPAFPPFVRLACFRMSGEIEYDVRKTSENIAAACRLIGKKKQSQFEVLGPVPSPLEKIKDNYRWQILLKSQSIDVLHMTWEYVEDNKKQLKVGKTQYTLDIDPENMM